MFKGRNQSWKQVKHSGKMFIGKIIYEKDSCIIMASDLIFLWIGTFSEPELHTLISSLNPLIEGESGSSLVPKALSLLEERFDGKSGDVHFTVKNDCLLHLAFQTGLGGIPFKIEVDLVKQSPHIFYEEIIDPFLKGASVLLSRQDLLISFLEAKDREIEQYKLEGCTITRANIMTEPFSQEEFLSKSPSGTKPHDLQCFLDTVVNVPKDLTLVESPQKMLLDTQEELEPLPSKVEILNTTSSMEKVPTPETNKTYNSDKPAKKKKVILKL